MKVLVADDDPTCLELVRTTLHQAGYSVTTAGDSEQVLELVVQERPAAVLLDICMPAPDGFTVCRRLKDDPLTHLVPVVLFTEFPSMADRIRALQAGADGIVTKPLAMEGVLARVRALTRSSRGTETILLVEGQPDIRASARAILSLHGYRVLEAARADQALDVCQSHKGVIRLLVTDASVSGMSGRELARQVVQQRPLVRVLYTSWCTDSDAVRHLVLESGLTLVEKPFLFAELLTSVRGALDGR